MLLSPWHVPQWGLPPSSPNRTAKGWLTILPDLSDVVSLTTASTVTTFLMSIVIYAGPALRIGDLHELEEVASPRAMREISELIYETCKTYLITQGKFILILEIFIGIIIVL